MIQKIKNLILASSLLLVLALPAFAATPLLAAPVLADNGSPNQQSQINGNLCAGSNFNLNAGNTTDVTQCQSDTSTLSDKIKTILNVLSAVIGIVAVIMIIYAGFRYVTSAGSEGGVKSAKNAIIYAVIGLVVVALAQVIVHFVISNVT